MSSEAPLKRYIVEYFSSLRLGSRIRFEPAALRRWVDVQRGPEAPFVALGARRT
jgi:hypothetical protein